MFSTIFLPSEFNEKMGDAETLAADESVKAQKDAELEPI
jgi:hypothetical protein